MIPIGTVLRLALAVSALLLGLAAMLPAQSKSGAAGNPVVVIETSMGTITAELYQDKAPKTVANFLGYIKSNYYAGTIFHRVIKSFMIQGGGMTESMAPKPRTQPAIVNEAGNGLSNLRGTLAMARTSDVNSATSQFFINTVDNVRLDHRGETPADFGYCVFGKVLEGMDVVDKIAAVAVGDKAGSQNVPLQPITIKSVQLKRQV
jgi:peptidyl-prolyl cis-trans isomerase B (cyclophilin B)